MGSRHPLGPTSADFGLSGDYGAPALESVEASVSPDGSAVTLEVCLSANAITRTVKFQVSDDDVARFADVVNDAACRMLARKALAHDRGHSWLDALCAAASKPIQTDFRIDPTTGDLFIISQFKDRPPSVTRRPRDEAVQLLHEMIAELNKKTC